MFNYYKTDFKKPKKRRDPVYSLAEFAKKTGLSRTTLARRMKASSTAPEVQMKNKNASFYNLTELERWHADYSA